LRSITMATAGVLAAAAVLGTATPAAADVPAPEVQWVNDNVVVSATDPTSATVLARYRCYGGENHLWVSVKQGEHLGDAEYAASLGPDVHPYSSALADAWYDTNYLFDPEIGPLEQAQCDGVWHTERVTVRITGWMPSETLAKGRAWVQFCLYTAGGFVTNEGWRTVKFAPGLTAEA
jgi:hypothetical protein